MPLPRFERLPKEKQERILKAAVKVFTAQGYEKASLNLMLEGAGISKGAAYYYFADKADLIGTVVRRYWLEPFAGTGTAFATVAAVATGSAITTAEYVTRGTVSSTDVPIFIITRIIDRIRSA